MDRSPVPFHPRHTVAGPVYSLLLVMGLSACGSESPTTPDDDDPRPSERIAFLKVITTTDGLLLDPDGYSVEVVGGSSKSLAPNGEIVVEVEPGARHLDFSGVSANCTPHGNPDLFLSLVNGDTTTVHFAVTCFRDPVAFGMLIDQGGGWQVHLIDASGGPTALLTSFPGMDNNFLTGTGPAFNPARTHITLQSNDDGEGFGEYDVYVVALNKSEVVRTTLSGPEFAPAWSADGSRIVFSGYDWGGSSKVFVASPDLTTVEELSPDGATWDSSPILSPDGTRIAFTRDEDVVVMAIDGSDPVNVSDPTGVRPDGVVDILSGWSADGSRILFKRLTTEPVEAVDLWIVDVDGTNPDRLTSMISPWAIEAFGPDGRIYYTHCLDGPTCSSRDVWAMNADGSGATPLTATGNETFSGAFNPTVTFEGMVEAGTSLISVQNPLGEVGAILRMGLDGGGRTELVAGTVDYVRWN